MKPGQHIGTGIPALRRLRQQACRALQRSGVTDTPRLDADVLLGHVIGFTRAQLFAYDEALLDAERVHTFAGLVQRRLTGEPIAYLTGEQEFYGLPFRVTPDTLVPRADTETLIETTIELTEADAPERILDLGTGTGCIGIVMAHAYISSHVWATDANAGARAVAADNAERLGCMQRFTIVDHAFGAPLPPEVPDPVDLVLCNPPYLTAAEYAAAPRAVCFEPRAALLAGEAGLDAYPAVIATAEAVLRPGCWFLMEIGAAQADAVRALLSPEEWEPPEVRQDLAGLDRVVAVRRHP